MDAEQLTTDDKLSINDEHQKRLDQEKANISARPEEALARSIDALRKALSDSRQFRGEDEAHHNAGIAIIRDHYEGEQSQIMSSIKMAEEQISNYQKMLQASKERQAEEEREATEQWKISDASRRKIIRGQEAMLREMTS